MKRHDRRAGDVALVRRCRICSLEQALVVNRERGLDGIGAWVTRDEERIDAVIQRWTLKHLARATVQLGLTPEQVAAYREDPESAQPFNRVWRHVFQVQMARTLGIEPDYNPARPGGSVGWHDRHSWRKTFNPWPLARPVANHEEERRGGDWIRTWTPEDDLRDADDPGDGAR